MFFPPYAHPDTTILDVISDVLMVASGAGILAFTVSYIAFFAWRRTAAGKAIMYFALSLCALLGQIIVSRLTGGDYPLRDLTRFFAYAVVLCASWGLAFTLWRNWARGSSPIELKQRSDESHAH